MRDLAILVDSTDQVTGNATSFLVRRSVDRMETALRFTHEVRLSKDPYPEIASAK